MLGYSSIACCSGTLELQMRCVRFLYCYEITAMHRENKVYDVSLYLRFTRR